MLASAYRVALVVPLSGSGGLYGPSCVLCARLAVEEVNAAGGLLGEPVELSIVDGGAAPETVAAEIDRLVTAGRVDAVVGWHVSAVRHRLAPLTRGRVPYVYTALYEGGEATPGVFAIGETPEIQLRPALDWMADEIGVHRWFVIGNDYVWPHHCTAHVRRFLLERQGVEVDGAAFVPLGRPDFDLALRHVEQSGCDGVLMFLVGDDAVAFNRQFAERGLQQQCARLATLMDEGMLRAIGPKATEDVFVAAGWFEALPTAPSLDFGGRYVRRFGVDAPAPGAPAESCYEGLTMLADLVNQTGSRDLTRLCAVAESARYQGPRGEVTVDGGQSIYLATADGTEFDVLSSF
jgi:urea transport system substrate-binding protein